MPREISKELRKLIEDKYTNEGKTYSEISAELHLKYRSVQTVIQAMKFYAQPGHSRRPRGASAKLNQAD